MDQVVVTLADVWEELKEQKEILNSIDARLGRMGDAVDNQTTRLNDHEKRLRYVERRVWALPSAATIIAAAALLLNLLR